MVHTDAKSGIQRVTRAILSELLNNPPQGFRVEPVYATGSSAGYFYAREFSRRFLGREETAVADELIQAQAGDVFLGLDLQPVVVPAQETYLLKLRNRGVKVYFMVYDLLPVTMPQTFTPFLSDAFSAWLKTIVKFDGALCISRATLTELEHWIAAAGFRPHRPYKLGWLHLGADVEHSIPTTGIPADAGHVLDTMRALPSFLMVGTIEPRKGQAQILNAFEQLWAEGLPVGLIIIGKPGWKMEPFIARLERHPQLNDRLYWLKGISDEYLEKIYDAATCLIAASEGEGFGLPLIEAAQHKLPIIARDIPVFREVAGPYAYYFNAQDPSGVAAAIKQWLAIYREKRQPDSAVMPWLTWKQCADRLKAIIFEEDWSKTWQGNGQMQ